QPAWIAVRLLDPLPLGEGIAEDHDSTHAGRLRPELHVAEAERVVAELDRPGGPPRHRVEADGRHPAIALARLLVAEVEVEIPARVGGITVEESAPLGVHDTRGVAEARRLVSLEAQGAFDEQAGDGQRAGDEGRRARHRTRPHGAHAAVRPRRTTSAIQAAVTIQSAAVPASQSRSATAGERSGTSAGVRTPGARRT